MTGFYNLSPGAITFVLGIVSRIIPYLRIGSVSVQADYPNKTLAVIIPVHNGEKSIGDVLNSVKKQSRRADRIIVADDASTDSTPAIAISHGVKYIRSDQHLGRAGMLNLAIQDVGEELVLTLDDDTTLHPDFIRELMPVFYEHKVALACGFVIPNMEEKTDISGNLVRAHRLVTYTFGQEFSKRGQLLINGVIVSAGCCSMFRTDVIKEHPFRSRNMVEDMDLTWELQEKGFQVGFSSNAIAYTIEPHSFEEYTVQGTRWLGGFWNNLHDHSNAIFKSKGLAASIMFPIAEAIWLPIYYGCFVIHLLSYNFVSAAVLLGIDIGLVALATFYKGRKLGKTRALLVALPATFVMRFYDSWLWVMTSIKYGLLNKRVSTWNTEDKVYQQLTKKYKLRKCHNCNKFSLIPYHLWDKGEMKCKNKKCENLITWRVSVVECWHFDHDLCQYSDPKHCNHQSVFGPPRKITCPRLSQEETSSRREE